MTLWHGLCGPTAMPKALVDRLNTEVANAVSSADLRSRLEQMGFDPQSSTASSSLLYQVGDSKWAKVVKDAGIPSQ